METVTMTLADFLLARCDDDEADARACKEWSDCFACPTRETFDTARVLAACEAKRRIVSLHPRHDWLPEGRDECAECGCADDFSVAWPCPTLRALATEYADHADYRDEWRP